MPSSFPGHAAPLLLLLASPALGACGEPSVTVDASVLDGSLDDARVPFDAATELDAATGADASADAATEIDAYVAPDAPQPDAGPPPPVSFYATGAIVEYVVPAGVTALRIVAEGASGGAAVVYAGTSVCAGGRGARVETTIGVTPGESISVLVGRSRS